MRFGVVGDPVMHSLSPAIHSAGFGALGVDATYEHLPTPADSFDGVVKRLRSGDLDGVSVTMPHKANALNSVDEVSDLARRSGAVNTIIVTDDGTLFGTNTDVAGVVHAMATMSVSQHAPVLVLGAGGAARAAVVALADRAVFVSARDEGTAAEIFAHTSVAGTVVPWGEGVAGAVIVNATPLGMKGEELPGRSLAVGSALLDMTYGASETPACRSFRLEELPCADGLDMLVGQAMEAFEIFTGQRVPLQIFEDVVRSNSDAI